VAKRFVAKLRTVRVAVTVHISVTVPVAVPVTVAIAIAAAAAAATLISGKRAYHGQMFLKRWQSFTGERFHVRISTFHALLFEF
jgi:hypothetical protein